MSYFVGKLQVFSSTPGGTGDYVVTGLFADNTGQFSAGQITAGDVITDFNGHNYTITAVNGPTSFDVADDDTALAPANGAGSICRPTTNLSLLYPTTTANGISEWLVSYINYRSLALIDTGYIPTPSSSSSSTSSLIYASQVIYDNTISGLDATTAQDALDEIATSDSPSGQSFTGFTYSDYILLDDVSERLTRLKLHVKEVTDLLVAPLSQNIETLGYTRESLTLYLKDLKEELEKLRVAAGDNAQESVTFLSPVLPQND